MSNSRKEIIYREIAELEDRLVIARAEFYQMTKSYDQLIDATERDETYADQLRELKSRVYESRLVLQKIKQEKDSLLSELRVINAALLAAQSEDNNTDEQEAVHRGYRI